MPDPKISLSHTYTLPVLVMLDEEHGLDELKTLTNAMHEHLQKVRFQVFLGEVYRHWPPSGVSTLRFSIFPGDSHDRMRVYAHCEGDDREACNQFVHWVHNASQEDESFLRQFSPLFDDDRTVTREGMETLWRTFVGPEAVAQHMEANLEGTQGQAAPKLRM